MSYRIRKKISVQKSVRRIAAEQIDKAIGVVSEPRIDRHVAIHEARKRCKKLRGLIRLVRPAFPEYGRENADVRDAARALSSLRDAQSMLDCFDGLVECFREQLGTESLGSIHDELTRRRQAISDDESGLDQALKGFLQRMRALRQRVDGWRITADGYRAVAGGLKRTYRRGRRALRRAYRDDSAQAFHEWRKRTKYHRYHARLLRGLWPEMMEAQRGAARVLGDRLGDDHDLVVLRRTLLADPEAFGSARDLQMVTGLIDRRRAQLLAEARSLGERLFAEKPSRLRARYRCYWRAWKVSNHEPPELSGRGAADSS
jgi:CHAD domain-containing protein